MRTRMLWATILILAGSAFGASWSATAQAPADWTAARRAEHARWLASHPGAEAGVAELKVQTAALVLAAGPPSSDIAAAPVVRRVPGAPAEIWDDPVAPLLVVVPAGAFTMGSPAAEAGRIANEGPQVRVTINYAFAVGKYPVSRDEFAVFVAETDRPDPASCSARIGPVPMAVVTGVTWRSPSFAQTGDHPVVCVSWTDAQAYVDWLSGKAGKPYRLLSEAEWEYATRAGTTTPWPWGEAASHENANYGMVEPTSLQGGARSGRDLWMNTSPVGSFPPNAFGLYDMIGNAWTWVQDCYQPRYTPPRDGSPLTCGPRSPRGAAWNSPANFTRSAYRYGPNAANRMSTVGFRVARSL